MPENWTTKKIWINSYPLYYLPRLNQEEIENVNLLITGNDTESQKKKKKKSQPKGQDKTASQGEL